MAYRNDVEALEARLRGLEIELTGHQRARDEAARLLAEAKACADHERSRFGGAIREAAVRRRRRWRWFVAGVAAVVAVAAGVALLAGYVEHRRRALDFDAYLEGYQRLVDDMCRCTDEPCVRRVDLEIRWRFEPPEFAIAPDTDSIDRWTELHRRRFVCEYRPLKRGPSDQAGAP